MVAFSCDGAVKPGQDKQVKEKGRKVGKNLQSLS